MPQQPKIRWMSPGDAGAPGSKPAQSDIRWFGEPGTEAATDTSTVKPPPTWEQRLGGYARRAGAALVPALKSAAPTIAAIGTTAVDPLMAPVTAPAAYFATKGLLAPKDVAQHPYRETAMAATMGLPMPSLSAGRAVGRRVISYAARRPEVVRTIGRLGGMAAGAGLGTLGKFAGEEGLLVGEAGGLWAGRAAGGDIANVLIKAGERQAAAAPEREAGLLEEELNKLTNTPLEKPYKGLSKEHVALLNRGAGRAYDPLEGSPSYERATARPFQRPLRVTPVSERPTISGTVIAGTRSTPGEYEAATLAKKPIVTPSEGKREADIFGAARVRARPGEGVAKRIRRLVGGLYPARTPRGTPNVPLI